MRDNKTDKGVTIKEQILAKVRNATIEKPEALFKDIDLQSETWEPINEEDGNAITFVQKFKDMGGIFVYLETEDELGECIRQLAPQNGWEPLWCTHPNMQELLDKYGVNYKILPQKQEKQKLVAITDCESLVAQTGSIVLSDGNTLSRKAYTEPEVLLVVARAEQIVGSLKEAFKRLKAEAFPDETSQIVILTGPTKTYDIEQKGVSTVLGPRQIADFLIDD